MITVMANFDTLSCDFLQILHKDRSFVEKIYSKIDPLFRILRRIKYLLFYFIFHLSNRFRTLHFINTVHIPRFVTLKTESCKNLLLHNYTNTTIGVSNI